MKVARDETPWSLEAGGGGEKNKDGRWLKETTDEDSKDDHEEVEMGRRRAAPLTGCRWSATMIDFKA